ncbi:MAG TPA: PEP-CTERM sorting domain-containing protein [Chthoniobacterales bacterium]|jgi:hypothetical protein|nr:PEP-CTERM sorting domain-containing protein [Chthoniobacterales bacterium]
MKKTSLTLMAGLALGLFAAGANAEPVLLNGSFENPVVSPGSVTPGGGDNWTPSDSTGVFLISNGNGIGDTPYGVQFLGLNGESAASMFESDSQTIAGFEAGVTYVLGVDFADALGGDDPMLTITLSGAFNGSQLYTAPVGGPYGADQIPFTSAVFLFTASASGSETITLTNSSIDSAIAIDNVSLYGNAPSVPEPTSFAALLLGAALLGGVALARRRAGQAAA